MQQISLNFNRADFEELYFKKDTVSITSGQLTKRPFVFLLIGVVLFVLVIFYSIINGIGLPLYTSVGLLVILFQMYLKAFRSTMNWKKTITKYLDKESRYNSHVLMISDTHFWLKQDENEMIQKWEDFNFVNITDERIWLDSNENILIPSKSVSEIDYNTLKDVIRKRVKEKQDLNSN